MADLANRRCNEGQTAGRSRLMIAAFLTLATFPLGDSRAASAVDIYADVLAKLRGHLPGGTAPSAASAERAIDRWLVPYLLFRVGLLAGWEHLDDEAL